MLDDARQSDLRDRLRRALGEADLEPGPPHACSYLPDREARDLAFRTQRLDPGVFHALMDENFRRSGTIVYRPACETCRQCRTIRVPVDAFRPNRAQRRCLHRNQDLDVEVGVPEPTREKHVLFRRYVARRHAREMDHGWRDFCDFLYASPVTTVEVMYRLGGRLTAVGILDVEPTAASTVYCYFDPTMPQRSLGTFNVLWTIVSCRMQELSWLYLGYYIRDCPKMNYKINFRPCEILEPDGRWRRVERIASA